MTQKTIGQNTGQSRGVNLTGPELVKFDTEVEDVIKVDIAESRGIAKANIENSKENEFVIVSKPRVNTSPKEQTNE